MKFVCIIPARYSSTRFPGKPLQYIDGKLLIHHVCDRCIKSGIEVLVATDSEKIADMVVLKGYRVIMTSTKCKTGTDRVAEAAQYLIEDYVINVQGDEPLIDYIDIEKALEACYRYKMPVNMYCYTTGGDNINTIKTVMNKENHLLYMRVGHQRSLA